MKHTEVISLSKALLKFKNLIGFENFSQKIIEMNLTIF